MLPPNLSTSSASGHAAGCLPGCYAQACHPPLQCLSEPAPDHSEMQATTEQPPATDSLSEHSLQAGCAAVVALMVGRTLYVANAGDSRAVLCRGSTAKAMSFDHKPAQDQEKARIVAAGGFVSDIGGVVRWAGGSLCVSNLGAQPLGCEHA